ncbi:sensor histidine kinase [Mucilaginibacter sp. BT774]|uniref:sensor histidine kinase n=1 Tax=Mucilaginibacter sp. BT774 TaxID=3062276 RepID=UPI00267724E8|nr:sensor histidine kinase [Mucilaginibacter sp. BT774]MDO3628494.1 sensor histidine kinase [Mucilaginibacter sp. BT774]
MFKFRAYQIIFHIAGWLLFMALPLLFLNGGQDDLALILGKPLYWVFCITYVFLFYLNSYILIPHLFLKKKYTLYVIVILALLAGTYYLKPYDRLIRSQGRLNPAYKDWSPMRDRLLGKTMPGPPHGGHMYSHEDGLGGPPPEDSARRFGPPPGLRTDSVQRLGPYGGDGPRFVRQEGFGHHRPFDVISFFIFLMIVALSTAMKIMEQWRMTEKRAIQAESDKASAELSFLKAQINPHFLFNTLNNIYTLTLMKDDHAPDSILKLSNIMRYVTDDAMADFVSLQQEVDCIYDYIELQRLRLGEKTEVEVEISGDIDEKKVPPLILMTFVENVFKYGVSKHHKSSIIIKLDADKTGINFFCQNSIFPEKNEKRRVGIGLKNTKQRLEHLYPNKHILDINTDNQMYSVKLTLQTA